MCPQSSKTIEYKLPKEMLVRKWGIRNMYGDPYSSLNSLNSGIGLFYANSGLFDGKNRFFWRIGSKPFL